MSHTAVEPKSRALAMIAIIVAGASQVIYWKFFPDAIYVALVLGLAGVVLGLVAWLRARKSKAEGRGMALAAIIVSMLSFGLLATHVFVSAFVFAVY